MSLEKKMHLRMQSKRAIDKIYQSVSDLHGDFLFTNIVTRLIADMQYLRTVT